MASYRKRGDSWHVRVFKQGIIKYSSFPTKAQAVNWAIQVESEILAGTLGAPSEKTFADAVERYDRLKLVQSSTVNRELNLMSALFEQCRREWQWVKVNPVHDVKRPSNPKHRERIFTDVERDVLCVELGFNFSDLVEAKQQIIAVAFLFALETAMRREEITTLEWSRIDLKRRFLLLPLTKNGDARQVPLSKRAIELLELLKGFDKPFSVAKDVLSTLFRRACLNAQVDNATFHDARATALTRLSKKFNVLELARMVGYRDIRSLQVYYRETASELALKLD